jgi:hypothetical protein
MTPVQERPDICFFASLSQHRVASIAGLFVSYARRSSGRRSYSQAARCRSQAAGLMRSKEVQEQHFAKSKAKQKEKS